MADINLEGAQETVAQAKAVATNSDFRAEAIQMDVSLEDSVKAAIAHTIQLFGRIDYSIHCAGVSWDPILIRQISSSTLLIIYAVERSLEEPLTRLPRRVLRISSTSWKLMFREPFSSLAWFRQR